MASVTSPGRSTRTWREGVALRTYPAEARDEQVAQLDRPWIAEEGPLAVRFTRLEPGSSPELFRGLAFDAQRTVTWDEDAVTVIASAEPDGATVAFANDVLVRQRFADLPPLVRIDYVKHGVWQGSRYLALGDQDASRRGANHA